MKCMKFWFRIVALNPTFTLESLGEFERNWSSSKIAFNWSEVGLWQIFVRFVSVGKVQKHLQSKYKIYQSLLKSNHIIHLSILMT